MIACGENPTANLARLTVSQLKNGERMPGLVQKTLSLAFCIKAPPPSELLRDLCAEVEGASLQQVHAECDFRHLEGKVAIQPEIFHG